MASDREIVLRALYDAIDWQFSLADAWPVGSPERAESQAQVKRYRAILRRRYGHNRTPMEVALDGADLVTIDELRRRAQGAPDEH